MYNGNSSFSSLKKYSFYYTLLLETRIRPGLKYGISLCLLKLSYHDQKYYESKLDKFDFFLNAHHMSTSHLKLLRGLKCPLFLRRKSNPKRILYNMWQYDSQYCVFFSFTMEVTLERHLYGYSLQPALKTDLNGSGEYQKSSEQYVTTVFLCLQAPNS